MKLYKDKKGIALMLVLASLVVLTTVATEFAYNTNIGYHMALNERDRLKAQYMAMSAYRFMLVELKFDKAFRQVVEKQNLGQFLSGSTDLPLCQQFPMSTPLIRAVFLGEGGEGTQGAEGEGGEEAEGEGGGTPLPEELQKMVSMAQREGAESFLDFVGDFEGECIDESTKINLNSFAVWKPDKVTEGKLNDYDQFKEFLIKFLSNPSYEDLFEKADVKPEDVVRNIADWVDSNERINDPGGVMGAPEDTLYERKELRYPLKNYKFSTPDEVYLVEGVLDDWYFPMQNNFTIYGEDKVDVCSAPSDVVLALIRRYVESKPDALPIKWDDQETTDKLLTAISDGCAMGGGKDKLKKNVSDALEAALAELGGTPLTTTPTEGQTGSGSGTEGTSGTGSDSGAAAGFGQYMSTERRFYTLKLTGMVGDIIVTIRTTLDVKEKEPKNWKILYWKVQ